MRNTCKTIGQHLGRVIFAFTLSASSRNTVFQLLRLFLYSHSPALQCGHSFTCHAVRISYVYILCSIPPTFYLILFIEGVKWHILTILRVSYTKSHIYTRIIPFSSLQLHPSLSPAFAHQAVQFLDYPSCISSASVYALRSLLPFYRK